MGTAYKNADSSLQSQINTLRSNYTELGKSVANGKNLIGGVVGGNSNNSFQELANNVSKLINERDTYKNNIGKANTFNLRNTTNIDYTGTYDSLNYSEILLFDDGLNTNMSSAHVTLTTYIQYDWVWHINFEIKSGGNNSNGSVNSHNEGDITSGYFSGANFKATVNFKIISKTTRMVNLKASITNSTGRGCNVLFIPGTREGYCNDFQ